MSGQAVDTFSSRCLNPALDCSPIDPEPLGNLATSPACGDQQHTIQTVQEMTLPAAGKRDPDPLPNLVHVKLTRLAHCRLLANPQ